MRFSIKRPLSRLTHLWLAALMFSSPAFAADLPTPTARYTALGQMNLGQGPIVIRYWGNLKQLRLELPPLGKSTGTGTVMLLNYRGGESYIYPVGSGLPEDIREYTALTLQQAQALFPEWIIDPDSAGAVRQGVRMIAGEPCNLWKIALVDGQPLADPILACMTWDGALLQLQKGDRVIFRTLSFSRQDNPDALFQPPKSYEADTNQSELDNYRS